MSHRVASCSLARPPRRAALVVLRGLAAGLLACAAASVPAACSSDDAAQSGPAGPQPIQRSTVAGFENSISIGDVLIAGQPTPLLLANARDADYTVVINARPRDEMSFDEGAIVKGLGMRYVAIPFTAETLDDTQVATFIAEIRGKGEGKVLAHCSSGNRIAALWAMYEITELKVPPEEAVARARTAGLKSPELIAYIGEYSRRNGVW